MTEIASDPRQPRRLEKKTNMPRRVLQRAGLCGSGFPDSQARSCLMSDSAGNAFPGASATLYTCPASSRPRVLLK